MQLVPPWMDGVAFTNAQGRDAGLTDAVMRRRAFERPFHGVRLIGSGGSVDGGLIDRCAHLRVALGPDIVYSHTTAARLWGMPLPRWLDDEVHVLTAGGAVVRRPGVMGWKRGEPFAESGLVHGLPVTTPADTWASLATMTADRGGRLPREWLVAIGDFLVSGRRHRRGRDAPLASPADLERALIRHGARRGAVALDWAAPRIRHPVDSPPETFLRLGLVRARLPEPAVQPAVATSAGLRHPDLGYLDARLLIEYLGDVHRSDPETWRKDLQRVQLFEDAGYRVILVGADDLTADGLLALCARVRRALRSHRTPSKARR